MSMILQKKPCIITKFPAGILTPLIVYFTHTMPMYSIKQQHNNKDIFCAEGVRLTFRLATLDSRASCVEYHQAAATLMVRFRLFPLHLLCNIKYQLCIFITFNICII